MYLARCSEEKGEIDDLLIPGEDSSGETTSSEEEDEEDESEESAGYEDGDEGNENELGNVDIDAEAGGPQHKLHQSK